MYFMIFIFFVELLFGILPNFVVEINALVCKVLFKVSDEELNARSEITDLKNQQSQLSVSDDFAKYAKLQRRVDKLMSQVKEKGIERKNRVALVRMVFTGCIYALHAAIILGLLWTMRSQPLLNYPPEWFYPLSMFVAFPTGKPGALGIGCWLLVSNSVVYRAKSLMFKTTVPVAAMFKGE